MSGLWRCCWFFICRLSGVFVSNLRFRNEMFKFLVFGYPVPLFTLFKERVCGSIEDGPGCCPGTTFRFDSDGVDGGVDCCPGTTTLHDELY